jgi:predicted phosphatase
MAHKDPFAIIIPDEADLTAPIAAATELSKLYIVAREKLIQLEAEIWTEEITDSEGNVVRTITHIPRDFKWLMDYMRKIGADISKLTANVQAKQVDNKLKVLDIFMNSDAVPKEQKEEFVAQALRKRINITEGDE